MEYFILMEELECVNLINFLVFGFKYFLRNFYNNDFVLVCYIYSFKFLCIEFIVFDNNLFFFLYFVLVSLCLLCFGGELWKSV